MLLPFWNAITTLHCYVYNFCVVKWSGLQLTGKNQKFDSLKCSVVLRQLMKIQPLCLMLSTISGKCLYFITKLVKKSTDPAATINYIGSFVYIRVLQWSLQSKIYLYTVQFLY